MQRSFSSFIAILIVFFTLSSNTSGAASMSSASHDILEQSKLLRTEGESQKARKNMIAIPHAKLVTAVREGLQAGGEGATAAAQMANALRLTEVVPDLEKALRTGADWQIILALGALANEEQKKSFASTWLTKISSFESPERLAVYETLGRWNVALTEAQFDKGIADESLGVRQAVVREFIITREKLSVPEQIDRYRKALALDPYQVRFEAMLDFENLSLKDRHALASVIDKKFKARCQAEDKPDVKTECEKILKGAK